MHRGKIFRALQLEVLLDYDLFNVLAYMLTASYLIDALRVVQNYVVKAGKRSSHLLIGCVTANMERLTVTR